MKCSAEEFSWICILAFWFTDSQKQINDGNALMKKMQQSLTDAGELISDINALNTRLTDAMCKMREAGIPVDQYLGERPKCRSLMH